MDATIFFRMRVIMSGTVIARKMQMIPVDSFWTLLLIRSTSKVTSGQRLIFHRSNIIQIAVMAKYSFMNYFWTDNDRESAMAPSCFSRRYDSNDIWFDLERLRSKFDLRSRSRNYRNRSCCISIDASWWDKHNEAIPNVLSLFNQELLTNNCL